MTGVERSRLPFGPVWTGPKPCGVGLKQSDVRRERPVGDLRRGKDSGVAGIDRHARAGFGEPPHEPPAINHDKRLPLGRGSDVSCAKAAWLRRIVVDSGRRCGPGNHCRAFRRSRLRLLRRDTVVNAMWICHHHVHAHNALRIRLANRGSVVDNVDARCMIGHGADDDTEDDAPSMMPDHDASIGVLHTRTIVSPGTPHETIAASTLGIIAWMRAPLSAGVASAAVSARAVAPLTPVRSRRL